MKKKLSFLFLLLITCSFTLLAQVTIKGVIVDKDTKESLIGATVSVPSENVGVMTDLDGSFTLKISKLGEEITISYIGYHTKTIKSAANMGEIGLETSAIGLDDVVVTSSVAIRRKTPVALSVVEPEFIEAKLGTQEFPEILKSTPGVYATKDGGGFGDAKLRIRGFGSENMAVMINGVPMNDMEWGGLYWSNYAGLNDVTRSMQVQRGLGAAKVASPSIGGSVNIVTKSTDAKKGGHVYYGLGNDGYNKVAASVSTGLTDKNWAMTFVGSKTWGDGYVMGTEFESYTWFVNISKIINHDHRISLTAFGAPQWHNQRKDQLNLKEWKQLGIQDYTKFNATFGYDENGERVNTSRNRYHKPQFSLNHMWTLNEKSSLSNVVYLSIGDGGGRRWRGRNVNDLNYGTDLDGNLNRAYRNPATNYVDYGAVRRQNYESMNGSYNVISESINNHVWAGLLSTYTTKLTDEIEFYGGLDIRYYAGEHTEEIVDLMGGKYFLDTYRKATHANALANPDWQNQKLMVGDKIYRDNTGYVAQEGFFSQAEYNKDKLSTFVSLSGSLSTYWREERYYEDHVESKSKTFPSFTVKGGANYNLDRSHNVFFNTGFMSRAPFMQKGYFTNMNQSNEINPNGVNEKSYSFEVGYGYRSSFFTANLNLYHTVWKDKTMVIKADTDSYVNLSGVDARHQGVELEFVIRPLHNLDIKGMVSIGDWIWNSNASGYAYDDKGLPLNGVPEFSDGHKVSINLKDVRVGNSAQTAFHLGANYRIPFLDGFNVGLDYNFQARNYADYTINNPNIGTPMQYYTPWKIPSFGLLDMNASYKMKVIGLDLRLSGNVNNVLNKEYIADAKDVNSMSPTGSTWDKVRAYYGFGRTYSVALKVNF